MRAAARIEDVISDLQAIDRRPADAAVYIASALHHAREALEVLDHGAHVPTRPFAFRKNVETRASGETRAA